MSTYVFDEYHHLTGFELLFPDGEIKPAFLLTSVSAFTERKFYAHHLRQFGLEEGIDFTVVNASELADTALGQCSMRGRRTVLSASGLIQLVFLGNSDFSVRMRRWMAREVIPAIMRDGYYSAPETDQMVSEIRQEMALLQLQVIAMSMNNDATLWDLIGTEDN